MIQPLIIGIRFQKVGKIYHFDASSCREIQPGDMQLSILPAVASSVKLSSWCRIPNRRQKAPGNPFCGGRRP